MISLRKILFFFVVLEMGAVLLWTIPDPKGYC